MRLIPALIVASLALAAPAARADSKDDHERARRAVAQGQALPLERMLTLLRRVAPGQVIEVEFEREDGRWTYEFKVLEPSGIIREVEMDARTGRVIEMEVERR